MYVRRTISRKSTHVLRSEKINLWNNERRCWQEVHCRLYASGSFQWSDRDDSRKMTHAVDLKELATYFAYGDVLLRLPRIPSGIKEEDFPKMFAVPHEPKLDTQFSFFMCRNERNLHSWINNIARMFKDAVTSTMQNMQPGIACDSDEVSSSASSISSYERPKSMTSALCEYVYAPKSEDGSPAAASAHSSRTSQNYPKPILISTSVFPRISRTASFIRHSQVFRQRTSNFSFPAAIDGPRSSDYVAPQTQLARSSMAQIETGLQQPRPTFSSIRTSAVELMSKRTSRTEQITSREGARRLFLEELIGSAWRSEE